MESLHFLANGFAIALQPGNLLFALIGCTLGTLVGVLPGLGPAGGTAILLPITFVMEPTQAIIMLAAIYYGAMYGGTITSVLLRVPGEAASAITCIDGYEMAKQGRGGAALAIAAIGSFIGGNVATMGLALVALPVSQVAVKFGPPESFALMVLGLTMVTGLAGKSLLRALVAAMLGLLIAMVGMDPTVGAPRFTFDRMELLDGFGIVPVVMGLFGVSEILVNVASSEKAVFDTKVSSLIPTAADFRNSGWAITRGSVIGFLLGVIPGIGATVPTFIAYAVEKNMSKTPEKFGTGMIEGVACPETANNAYVTAAMIPLLTLGIPGSSTTAIIMGALMMQGLAPGPWLFTQHADFVWAIIASFYIGNLILLVLNIPLIPLWVSLLRIPYSVLFALVVGFCVVGAYSLDNSIFDVGVMLGFAVVGYVFKKLDIPTVPVALTMILGPLMERGLRKSMEMSQGDFSILFTRPVTAALLAIAALFLLSTTLRTLARARRS